MNLTTALPNLKSKIFGGAYSVHDPETVSIRDGLIRQFTEIDTSDTAAAEFIKRDFLDTYISWMFRPFDFNGRELYTHACFTQGTTESFSQFYIRYRNHRLRIAKGEYFYHQMMKNLCYKENFAWLDQDELRAGDAVLISVPFSDTGSVPIGLNNMLDTCDRLDIPVMIDMAYLNLTVGSELLPRVDLSHPCIKYVVSSLSKVFPVENLRIGIRLQKEFWEDQIYVINERDYNYINLLSAFVGTGLMKKFASDFMWSKYRGQQLELCKQLGLEPSPCFIFGLDLQNNFQEYNRGASSNRLCFSRLWDGRMQNIK